ncbi:MAG: hypothetical protein JO214_04600 [Frankiaceae bacterium]|nr:hypothetical protein [Frankiaceae bacterium]
MEDSHCHQADVEYGGEHYLISYDEARLRVGHQVGGECRWLDEDVPVDTLPDDARDALRRKDLSSPALVTTLGGLISAERQRGG